ncbi:MAG: hypothetical protein QM539_08575 [Alphaproteobacteria bacterium]|nr:hypothetical protein [Alphaproteobacteria bacterium]
MRTIILSILLILSMKLCAQNAPEKLKPFSCGSIKPTGWLKEQMKKDIDGFVGNLDLLVPGLFQDPIYGKDRLKNILKLKT